MLSFCALILINICIPQDLIPVTTFAAMYSSAEMEARNARGKAGQLKSGLLIDMFASDSLVTVAQSNPAIHRDCNQKICVYYRRHCVSDHECEYVLATLTRRASDQGQEPVFSTSLKLATSDAAAFAKLASRLTFKIARNETDGQPEEHAISVLSLEHESPDTKIALSSRNSVPR